MFIRTVAVLVGMLLFFHTNQAVAQAKKYYKQGLSAYDFKQHKKAIPLFDKAIKEWERKKKKHKLLPETYHMRGWSHYILGNYELAAKDGKRATDLTQSFQGYYYLLGTSLMELMKFDEAIVALEKAVDIEKGLDSEPYDKIINVYTDLGECFAWKGNLEKAEYYYNKATSIDKGNNKALIERSKLFGRYYNTAEKAIEEIKGAYRVSIRDPYGLMTVGQYFVCLNQYEQARARFTLAGKLGGNEIISLYELAITYGMEGKPTNMQDTFDKILKKTPKLWEEYVCLADIYLKRNDANKAIEMMNKAMELSGCKACVLIERADLYFQMGRYEESYKDYSQLLEDITPNAQLYVKMAKAAFKMDKIEAAKSHLNTALELEPKLLDALYYRAIYYKELGRYKNQACLDIRTVDREFNTNKPCITELNKDMISKALWELCNAVNLK